MQEPVVPFLSFPFRSSPLSRSLLPPHVIILPPLFSSRRGGSPWGSFLIAVKALHNAYVDSPHLGFRLDESLQQSSVPSVLFPPLFIAATATVGAIPD